MKYLNETIEFNGITFKVLDVKSVDFSSADTGVKSKITKVIKATGGEIIETKNANGQTESIVVAEPNDAIFCNNDLDRYIPRDKGGNHLKVDNLNCCGYTVTSQQDNVLFVKSNKPAKLLIGAIKEPTCIKDAFGEGVHQFLYSGATLKQEIGTTKVRGIDKDAFESTWEIFKQDIKE